MSEGSSTTLATPFSSHSKVLDPFTEPSNVSAESSDTPPVGKTAGHFSTSKPSLTRFTNATSSSPVRSMLANATAQQTDSSSCVVYSSELPAPANVASLLALKTHAFLRTSINEAATAAHASDRNAVDCSNSLNSGMFEDRHTHHLFLVSQPPADTVSGPRSSTTPTAATSLKPAQEESMTTEMLQRMLYRKEGVFAREDEAQRRVSSRMAEIAVNQIPNQAPINSSSHASSSSLSAINDWHELQADLNQLMKSSEKTKFVENRRVKTDIATEGGVMPELQLGSNVQAISKDILKSVPKFLLKCNDSRKPVFHSEDSSSALNERTLRAFLGTQSGTLSGHSDAYATSAEEVFAADHIAEARSCRVDASPSLGIVESPVPVDTSNAAVHVREHTEGTISRLHGSSKESVGEDNEGCFGLEEEASLVGAIPVSSANAEVRNTEDQSLLARNAEFVEAEVAPYTRAMDDPSVPSDAEDFSSDNDSAPFFKRLNKFTKKAEVNLSRDILSEFLKTMHGNPLALERTEDVFHSLFGTSRTWRNAFMKKGNLGFESYLSAKAHASASLMKSEIGDSGSRRGMRRKESNGSSIAQIPDKAAASPSVYDKAPRYTKSSPSKDLFSQREALPKHPFRHQYVRDSRGDVLYEKVWWVDKVVEGGYRRQVWHIPSKKLWIAEVHHPDRKNYKKQHIFREQQLGHEKAQQSALRFDISSISDTEFTQALKRREWKPNASVMLRNGEKRVKDGTMKFKTNQNVTNIEKEGKGWPQSHDKGVWRPSVGERKGVNEEEEKEDRYSGSILNGRDNSRLMSVYKREEDGEEVEEFTKLKPRGYRKHKIKYKVMENDDGPMEEATSDTTADIFRHSGKMQPKHLHSRNRPAVDAAYNGNGEFARHPAMHANNGVSREAVHSSMESSPYGVNRWMMLPSSKSHRVSRLGTSAMHTSSFLNDTAEVPLRAVFGDETLSPHPKYHKGTIGVDKSWRDVPRHHRGLYERSFPNEDEDVFREEESTGDGAEARHSFVGETNAYSEAAARVVDSAVENASNLKQFKVVDVQALNGGQSGEVTTISPLYMYSYIFNCLNRSQGDVSHDNVYANTDSTKALEVTVDSRRSSSGDFVNQTVPLKARFSEQSGSCVSGSDSTKMLQSDASAENENMDQTAASKSDYLPLSTHLSYPGIKVFDAARELYKQMEANERLKRVLQQLTVDIPEDTAREYMLSNSIKNQQIPDYYKNSIKCVDEAFQWMHKG